MNKTKNYLLLCFSFLFFLKSQTVSASSICEGRVDVGPVYVHMDILEFGKTVRHLDMAGVRLDSTIAIYKRFCVKPTFTYAGNNGNLYNAGLAVGHFVPITKQLCITPYVGYAYTYVNSTFSFYNPFLADKLHFKTSFHSYAPNIGLDVHYKFMDCWRICGTIQYAWSRTLNRIRNIQTYHTRSRGPSVALSLERDIGEHWTVNIAGAYNSSLTREKHGLRLYGFKFGVARWF